MQAVASARSSSLSPTKQHNEHPKFDRIMLSKIEIAQDKMVDLLHDFQSMAQNCNEPAFFNKCAEHIQKALQSSDAARPAEQTAMHTDAHHLGGVQPARIAFGIQGVESVFEVLKEGVGVRVALG